MAKCLDEGVDPTQMCRSLVDRVSRSEVLKRIAEPELLPLFEDWLEELEKEFAAEMKNSGIEGLDRVADKLGLSGSGARFLKAKLEQEGKL